MSYLNCHQSSDGKPTGVLSALEYAALATQELEEHLAAGGSAKYFEPSEKLKKRRAILPENKATPEELASEETAFIKQVRSNGQRQLNLGDIGVGECFYETGRGLHIAVKMLWSLSPEDTVINDYGDNIRSAIRAGIIPTRENTKRFLRGALWVLVYKSGKREPFTLYELEKAWKEQGVAVQTETTAGLHEALDIFMQHGRNIGAKLSFHAVPVETYEGQSEYSWQHRFADKFGNINPVLGTSENY